MNPALVTVALSAAVALSPFSVPPSPPVSYPPSEVDSDWEATGDCLLGHWYLDVEDFAAQAAVYLKSLGIPLESLELTGMQRLSVTLDPDRTDSNLFEITNAIRVDAVVHGIPISADTEWAGSGQWFMAPQLGDPDINNTSNFVELDHWMWSIDPAATADPSAPPLPPLIDPGVGAQVNCAGDLLTLAGPGAPLIGHFRRGEAPPQSQLPAPDD